MRAKTSTVLAAVRFVLVDDPRGALHAIERWPGIRHANVIKTAEGSYCIIGEWDDMAAMAAARPHMIATLDTFRDTLAGETDPVLGPVVLAMK